MNVFENYGPQCFAAQPHRAFLENDDTIIFMDEGMKVDFLDHWRLLYFEGQSLFGKL